jgi:hypothetical protein
MCRATLSADTTVRPTGDKGHARIACLLRDILDQQRVGMAADACDKRRAPLQHSAGETDTVPLDRARRAALRLAGFGEAAPSR